MKMIREEEMMVKSEESVCSTEALVLARISKPGANKLP